MSLRNSKTKPHRRISNGLIKEAMVATLTIMIFVPLINFFSFKFELAKPIKQEFLDFDIYDLKFSGNNNKLTRDTNIVLVEIGGSRKAIADQVAMLDNLDPLVIGIDVVFGGGGDSTGTSYLKGVIQASKSPIVFASRINVEDEKPGLTKSFFHESLPDYNDGYANFIGDDYSVIRSWAPFAEVDGKKYPSFTAKIAELSAPETFKTLSSRDNELELINYEGNLENYTSFSYDELHGYLNSGQLAPKIRNKIILLGFFKKTAPLVLEDLHFTPVNEKVTGRSFPDMYGLAIHANILSMTLSGKYLYQLPAIGSYGIAGLITFLLMLFIISQYQKNPHPSHLKLLFVQIVLVIALIYFFLLVYVYFDVKVLLLPVILSLVLAVEMFSIYKSVAKWLHKRYRYNTIFSSQ